MSGLCLPGQCLDCSRRRGLVNGAERKRQLACLICRDFALISEQQVSFLPGFNVITGESGSGKSVLLAALSQALGAPANEDFIRPPSDTAVVQIVFRLSASGRVSRSTCAIYLVLHAYNDSNGASHPFASCSMLNPDIGHEGGPVA